MPNIQPLTLEKHGSKRWLRNSSYAFAAKDVVAPLVLAEIPTAAAALPIGFMLHQGACVPVAVLGLVPGQNLFVDSTGRWLGQYIPAFYRAYPFYLVPGNDGSQVLCIDESSGLVTDGPQGEPFFTPEQKPVKVIADVLAFLGRISASRKITENVCGLLQKHHLIQPWSLKLQTGRSERAVEGLLRIDDAALNALPAEPFLELRNAGALPLVYGQLLAMQNLSMLPQLARAHAEAGPAATPRPMGDTLDFSGLTP
ncbi:MAG: SapC family protein [Ramlibacter sp.]|nr:SapC family protein [Ramlibacter sp.]